MTRTGRHASPRGRLPIDLVQDLDVAHHAGDVAHHAAGCRVGQPGTGARRSAPGPPRRRRSAPGPGTRPRGSQHARPATIGPKLLSISREMARPGCARAPRGGRPGVGRSANFRASRWQPHDPAPFLSPSFGGGGAKQAYTIRAPWSPGTIGARAARPEAARPRDRQTFTTRPAADRPGAGPRRGHHAGDDRSPRPGLPIDLVQDLDVATMPATIAHHGPELHGRGISRRSPRGRRRSAPGPRPRPAADRPGAGPRRGHHAGDDRSPWPGLSSEVDQGHGREDPRRGPGDTLHHAAGRRSTWCRTSTLLTMPATIAHHGPELHGRGTVGAGPRRGRGVEVNPLPLP